jgi:hypothetical protein
VVGPELVWAFWRVDRSLAATRIRNMDRPSHSLFAMPTDVEGSYSCSCEIYRKYTTHLMAKIQSFNFKGRGACICYSVVMD